MLHIPRNNINVWICLNHEFIHIELWCISNICKTEGYIPIWRLKMSKMHCFTWKWSFWRIKVYRRLVDIKILLVPNFALFDRSVLIIEVKLFFFCLFVYLMARLHNFFTFLLVSSIIQTDCVRFSIFVVFIMKSVIYIPLVSAASSWGIWIFSSSFVAWTTRCGLSFLKLFLRLSSLKSLSQVSLKRHLSLIDHIKSILIIYNCLCRHTMLLD